ncbi:MAG: hypothetical protein IMZ43_06490 [Thermoplasmata archaeon]|nr:hypothetical protein [Thermoplasmata archaeon]
MKRKPTERFVDFIWIDVNTRGLPKYFSDCIKVATDIINDGYVKEPFTIDLSRIAFFQSGEALASIYDIKGLVKDGFTHMLFLHRRLIDNNHKVIENIIFSVLHEFIHYVKPQKSEDWVFKESVRLMKRVRVI